MAVLIRGFVTPHPMAHHMHILIERMTPQTRRPSISSGHCARHCGSGDVRLTASQPFMTTGCLSPRPHGKQALTLLGDLTRAIILAQVPRALEFARENTGSQAWGAFRAILHIEKVYIVVGRFSTTRRSVQNPINIRSSQHQIGAKKQRSGRKDVQGYPHWPLAIVWLRIRLGFALLSLYPRGFVVVFP